MIDMTYDGQTVEWNGIRYKATSGDRGYQSRELQDKRDHGPIPEGLYTVLCSDLGMARVADWDACALAPAWGIQTIPRGAAATNSGRNCERYWAHWGNNRVRLEPKRGTKTFARAGFYLHDSTKGYSSGCIEIQSSFFAALRNFVHSTKRNSLALKVAYVPGRVTNGGTLANG